MNDEKKQPRDTEVLILQAAEKEFLDKGYAGAKTTDIAEAAGVTHAMFHYYFRTKDKLFEKIVTDKIDKLGEILLGAVGNPDLPLKERISDGIERHFDFLVANPGLPRFIINELAVHPDRIIPIRSKLLETADEVLASVQKELDTLPGVSTTALMLLADIISLNVFPFVAEPMLKTVAGNFFNNYEDLLALRKKENVKTILTKLKLI